MTIRAVLTGGAIMLAAGVAAWALASAHASADQAQIGGGDDLDWYKELPPTLRGETKEEALASKATPEAPSDVDLTAFDALPPTDGPRLSFALPEQARALEFGEIRFATSKSLKITVANTGSAPLEVKGMKSSCGCLSLHSDKLGGVFEPGEQREVTLTYQATSRSAGIHRKVVTVLSSDPERPRFRLPVVAHIVLPLRITEPLIEFGPAGALEGQSATLRIVGLPDEPSNWSVRGIRTAVRQTRVETRELPFEVVGDRRVDGARELTLKITLGERRAPGRYVSPLIIGTDHPEQPQLLVQSVLSVGP